MDSAFCLRAFRSAVAVAGRAPEIMNTDQGAQFTSTDWIEERKRREGVGVWIGTYNTQRPHSSIENGTPDEAYFGSDEEPKWKAA
jgi:putative transposase